MLATIAALVLSVAVVGGATLSLGHLRRRAVPPALGLAHAATAAVGLGLLTLAALRQSQPLAVNAALLLFFIALSGGLFLLLFRRQRQSPPGFMIALHGLTATLGLALLWIGLLVSA